MEIAMNNSLSLKKITFKFSVDCIPLDYFH